MWGVARWPDGQMARWPPARWPKIAGLQQRSQRFFLSPLREAKKNGRPYLDPVYGRRVNSFVLVCSLSSHRHLFIPLIFGSRFVDS